MFRKLGLAALLALLTGVGAVAQTISGGGGSGTANLVVGTTPITGGTANYVLQDNGGTLEETPDSFTFGTIVVTFGSTLTNAQLTGQVNPCTSSLAGAVPTPPNNSGEFLNGQCGWSTPSSASWTAGAGLSVTSGALGGTCSPGCTAFVTNGLDVYTSSSTLSTSDNANSVVANCSSACTLTLPSSLPKYWSPNSVCDENTGTLTIDPSSGANFYPAVGNVGASSITVSEGQCYQVQYDGTNYTAWLDATPLLESYISGLGTAAVVNTGTSGGTLGLLNGNLTFSGNDTFSGNLTFSGLATGTQTSCLGLTSGNAVVPATGACGSGSGGGGALNYAASNLTLTAGTYYLSPGGASAPQSTESAAYVKASAAMTVSSLSVNISSTLGGSSTGFTVTFRDATNNTAVTCTFNPSSTTFCTDTHSFNVAKGDLIDWELVTTGTIVGTPTVNIMAAIGTSNVGCVPPGSTSNALLKDTGSSNCGDSSVVDNGAIVTHSEPSDFKANYVADEIANTSSIGTTVNLLAKLTGAPSTAVVLSTSDTVFQGIVASGAGTTGNAVIARAGQVSCVFDGATTAGDWVIPSTTTGGDCHDGGSTLPSQQVAGKVLSTNAAAGTYAVEVSPQNPGASSGSGASGLPTNYEASNWYLTQPGSFTAGNALTASTIYAVPFYLNTKLTIETLGVRVTTVGSSNIQLAIYAASTSSGILRPTGSALCSTSNISNGSATTVSSGCNTGSISAGWYFFEVNQNDSTGALLGSISTPGYIGFQVGTATFANLIASNTAGLYGVKASETFGTWPSETSTSWTELTSTTSLIGAFQVDSVP